MIDQMDSAAPLRASSCAGCSCGRTEANTGNPLSRREFVARSTLAAVAAVLAGACGDGIIGATGPVGTPGNGAGGATVSTFRLSDLPALANVGGIAAANAGGAPIALVRTGATTVAAFSLACPHQGTTVTIVGSGFRCPNHGATFTSAGTWSGGQQTGNLTSLGATLDVAAGTITVGATPGTTTPATGTSGNVSLVVRVASFPALGAVGGAARVDAGSGIPIGVARTGASTFVAYTLACPHQGTTVQLVGKGWRCANHGATFDSAGRVTAGPATTNLAALTTTYDAVAGTLTITGTAKSPTSGGGDDDDDDHGA